MLAAFNLGLHMQKLVLLLEIYPQTLGQYYSVTEASRTVCNMFNQMYIPEYNIHCSARDLAGIR